MIIPKIVVKSWQIAEEEELFLRFLKHPEFPTHRQLILNIFPELAKELENAPDEKIAVRAFLIKFDRTHRKAITHIVHNNRSIVAKQSKKALRALGNAMEHKWLKPITYSVIPTILPFSPYGTNHFNFSIIGYILNKKQHDVLMVAVHEISHFIFLIY